MTGLKCKMVLVFLTLTGITVFIQAQKNTRSQVFSIVKGHILLNSEYASIVTNGLQHCAQVCLRDVKCQSANFNMKNQICALNNISSNASERVIPHQDIIFIYPTDVTPDTTVNLDSSSFQQTPGTAEETCKEIYSNGREMGNGAYSLRAKNGSIFQVYCHMDNITGCGGGGWSLAMKIDGRKSTFAYSSKLWNNKVEYNPAAATTGLDNQETKTPLYWTSNATKLCLGMRPTNNASNITFISFVTQYAARSLFEMISDGNYRATALGRSKWFELLSDPSLQKHCNGEGFNTRSSVRARIGILGNNENHCSSSDSFLGFGTGGSGCGVDFSDISCGNGAPKGCGTPNRVIRKTFAYGYIFIQ